MESRKDDRKSVVIIGGGLGGLFSGALLAKEGFKVTIVEKHSQLGGGLMSFYRHGVEFATGMHVLGGFRKGGSVYKILNYLGILDKIKIRNPSPDCMDYLTILSDGTTYSIPSGKENFIRYFQQLFPQESENIKNYVEKLFQISEELGFFYLRPDNTSNFEHSSIFYIPADKLIEQYVGDERLQKILAYLNPLCGGELEHTPAFIFAIINVLYISGQSKFEGSSRQLTNALAELIRNNDGEIFTNQLVTKLNVDNGKVVSVETSSNNTFYADYFISSIHPATLISLTDTNLFNKAYRNRVSGLLNSYSAFCVYITFKPESFRYIEPICYCQADYSTIWNSSVYDEATWPEGFIYLTPCEDNQGEFANKMEVVSMMPYSACERWANTVVGKRGEDYKAWKNEMMNRILDKMERLYPGFRGCIEFVEAASPLTIRDYYAAPEGAIFGVKKDCENLYSSFIPFKTKIENLFQTGQNVNIHGCCGVPLTAINTTEAIVGEHVILNKINDSYLEKER